MMEKPQVIFGRINYILLAAGAILLAAGFILMGFRAGSVSHDIYSFSKITLSPFLLMAGYGLLIWCIFKK